MRQVEDPVIFTAVYDRIAVDDILVTVTSGPGRRARKRSKVDQAVTWPAPRTTVSLARTDASGQWQATLTYEGQSVVVVVAPRQLDALAVFAVESLGGMTNTAAEAEAARAARMAAKRAEF